MTFQEYQAERRVRWSAMEDAKAKLSVALNGYNAATVEACREDVDWHIARVRALDKDYRAVCRSNDDAFRRNFYTRETARAAQQ